VERGKPTIPPCDHFVLYASNLHLNMSEASGTVLGFIGNVSSALEESCKQMAHQLSSTTGRAYQEFMEPPIGRTTLVVTKVYDSKVAFARQI
jgi:hypothetical protein